MANLAISEPSRGSAGNPLSKLSNAWGDRGKLRAAILTLILANELRGLIIAAPSLWALSSVSPVLVWSAVAVGIVLSLVVPVWIVRRV